MKIALEGTRFRLLVVDVDEFEKIHRYDLNPGYKEGCKITKKKGVDLGSVMESKIIERHSNKCGITTNFGEREIL